MFLVSCFSSETLKTFKCDLVLFCIETLQYPMIRLGYITVTGFIREKNITLWQMALYRYGTLSISGK